MASLFPAPKVNLATLASYAAKPALDDNGRPIQVYSSTSPSDPMGAPTGTAWRQKADVAGVDKYVRNMQGTSGKADTQTQGATYLVNGASGAGSSKGGSTPMTPTATSEVLQNVGGGKSVWAGEDSAHGSTAMRANKFAEPARTGVRKKDALAALIEKESEGYINQRTRK